MGGKKKVETTQDNSLDEFSRQQYNTISGNINQLMGQRVLHLNSGQRVAGVQ